MKKRFLGADLEVSAVGLGCMGFSHAYGAPTDKKTAVETIRRSFEMGYNFFDTAEVYGTSEDPHQNETIVGEALRDVRNKVIIATKFGIKFDLNYPEVNKPLIPDSRPETIRSSVDASLKRLGTDHIDLYYQHRADPNVPVEEVAGVMSELIRAGKITHWGLSETNEEQLRRAHNICPVTAIQNRYSMMARWNEKLFPALDELGIGFVAFSPLANGFLSGKYGKGTQFDGKLDYRSTMPQFTEKGVEQNSVLLSLINNIATKKNVTSSQISLAWMMCKKPYIVPIPGTRKAERLRENAAAANVVLTSDEIAEIDGTLDHMEMSPVFGGSRIIKESNP